MLGAKLAKEVPELKPDLARGDDLRCGSHYKKPSCDS
jgi:hypothetical protein